MSSSWTRRTAAADLGADRFGHGERDECAPAFDKMDDPLAALGGLLREESAMRTGLL